MGPARNGLFGPIFSFWPFLDPMVRREITRRSFEGWWYSVFSHEDLHGWVLLVCLDHLTGSWTQAARLLDFGVEQIVWGGVLSTTYAA